MLSGILIFLLGLYVICLCLSLIFVIIDKIINLYKKMAKNQPNKSKQTEVVQSEPPEKNSRICSPKDEYSDDENWDIGDDLNPIPNTVEGISKPSGRIDLRQALPYFAFLFMESCPAWNLQPSIMANPCDQPANLSIYSREYWLAFNLMSEKTKQSYKNGYAKDSPIQRYKVVDKQSPIDEKTFPQIPNFIDFASEEDQLKAPWRQLVTAEQAREERAQLLDKEGDIAKLVGISDTEPSTKITLNLFYRPQSIEEHNANRKKLCEKYGIDYQKLTHAESSPFKKEAKINEI